MYIILIIKQEKGSIKCLYQFQVCSKLWKEKTLNERSNSYG